MANGAYIKFKTDLMSAAANLQNGGNAIYVALFDNTTVFINTNTTYADVSATEITGTGYVAGGVLLANQSVNAGATSYFDADDAVWNAATFTAAFAILYDNSNSNDLICFIDFGGDKTVSGGTFTIQWDVGGIIQLT